MKCLDILLLSVTASQHSTPAQEKPRDRDGGAWPGSLATLSVWKAAWVPRPSSDICH